MIQVQPSVNKINATEYRKYATLYEPFNGSHIAIAMQVFGDIATDTATAYRQAKKDAEEFVKDHNKSDCNCGHQFKITEEIL